MIRCKEEDTMLVSWRMAAVAAIAAVAGAAGISAMKAQAAPAVKRTVVLKQDTTIPGREVIMAVVEIPAGGAEGRHTHPAAEVYAFVQEGTMELEVEGQPTKTVKAGDVFSIPLGAIHQGINKGTATVKLSVVFVAEKGKPLTAPAP